MREALSHIEHLLRVEAGGCSERPSFRLPSPSASAVSVVSSISASPTMPTMQPVPSVPSIPSVCKPYDVEGIYNKLRRNDVRRNRMLNAKIRQLDRETEKQRDKEV